MSDQSSGQAPALRLVLENGPELVLDDLPLLHITQVDYGYPEVRSSVEPRSNADGVIDRTKYVGARVVTLTGKIGIDWPSDRLFGPQDSTMGGRRQQVVQALAPFLHPGRRPWLYSRFDDGSVKRIRLRADAFSRPQIADVQDISFSFASVGNFEDELPDEVTLVPEVAVEGRTYDLVHDRQYPHGSGTATRVTNEGDAECDWVARIFGPCTNPAIVNVSTGEAVYITLGPMNVPLGHFLEVDTANHTVTADGLPENSRWGAVDFPRTTFWRLPPGDTWVRFRCDYWEVPAQMILRWHHSHLF